MPPRNVAFILLTAMISFACYLKAERNRYAAQLGDAMRLVTELYVDDVKQRDLFENAMTGMLEGLDPYSSYIGPEFFKQMEQSLDQEFGGVGIEVEKESDESPIIVLSPLYDSPGYRAGLRVGDTILAIDGAKTIGMKQKDAIAMMRGKPGTKVKLTVRHIGSDKEVEIDVERAVIMVDSLLGDVRRENGTWDFHLQENPRIGYMRLTTFGKHSTEELQKALVTENGCPFDAIILDLRDNAGGLLDAAVDTCRLFINRGPIVSTRGRDGKVRSVYAANGTAQVPASIPMVVLVNRFSASASEIVAACLQDHGRAVIVGERTWGKGTVQNLFELEGGRSALKLTTASYWRPSGKNIHKMKDAPEEGDWGVQPDEGFEVKLTDEEFEKVHRARVQRDQRHSRKVLDEAGLTQKPVPMIPEPMPVVPDPSGENPPMPMPTPMPETQIPPAEDDSKPFDDPQLRKAIEYVEQKLAAAKVEKA